MSWSLRSNIIPPVSKILMTDIRDVEMQRLSKAVQEMLDVAS